MNSHRLNFTDPSNVFSTTIAMVLSPSVPASSAAIAQLKAVGVPADAITEYPFPGQALNLGFGAKADSFMSLMRMAFVEDPDALNTFVSERPFRVLRVTQNSAFDPPDLFPITPSISRETNITDGTAAGLSLSEMDVALGTLQ